jgi:hypothetical protein
LRTWLLFILGAALLMACGGTGPSPSHVPGLGSAPPVSLLPVESGGGPTSAPGASDAPGPVPATTERPGSAGTPRPGAPLLLNSLVFVRVDRLNVRERPTVDAKVRGVVEEGDFLRIGSSGPFSHDGYVWYLATFLAKAGEPPDASVDVLESDGVAGWIAVGRSDTSYVTKLAPRCPATVELASIELLLGSERLACFGDAKLELTGTFGCGGCGGTGPGIFEPSWLASPMKNPLTVHPVSDHLGPFTVSLSPSGPGAPPAGSVVRVRGHFDDPAAGTCTISLIDPLRPSGEDLVAVPDEAAVLACRQEFVAESFEILGTDPGFPFG